MENVNNLYDVLEISASASADEVRSAYLRLIRETHPDSCQNLPPNARRVVEQAAAEINAAYDILGNPQSRAQYDRKLAEQRQDSAHYNAAQSSQPSPAPPPPPPPPPRRSHASVAGGSRASYANTSARVIITPAPPSPAPPPPCPPPSSGELLVLATLGGVAGLAIGFFGSIIALVVLFIPVSIVGAIFGADPNTSLYIFVVLVSLISTIVGASFGAKLRGGRSLSRRKRLFATMPIVIPVLLLGALVIVDMANQRADAVQQEADGVRRFTCKAAAGSWSDSFRIPPGWTFAAEFERDTMVEVTRTNGKVEVNTFEKGEMPNVGHNVLQLRFRSNDTEKRTSMVNLKLYQ